MSPRDTKVLAAYAALTVDDPEGAWNPYHYVVIAAVGGDPNGAYVSCKALKGRGLLACNGRQGASLASSPAYWATDAGLALS